MRTGGRAAPAARGACLAAGLTFCLGIAHADHEIRVAITDNGVAISAQAASIRSVLESLASQANLLVVSQERLEEPVSVDINEPTLSLAIHRLLRQKSFMLHQSGHAPGAGSVGRISDYRLWIFAPDPSHSEPAWVSPPRHRPEPDSADELAAYQILALSQDGRHRQEAMFGLAESGGSGSVTDLRQGLSDVDRRVREAAIESLAVVGGEESVGALGGILSDPDAGLRIDAVDAIGRIGGDEAIALLEQAMIDENHVVREAAAEWLTELAWRRD